MLAKSNHLSFPLRGAIFEPYSFANLSLVQLMSTPATEERVQAISSPAGRALSPE